MGNEKQPLDVFCKKSVLKNCVKFIGKNTVLEFLFIKVAETLTDINWYPSKMFFLIHLLESQGKIPLSDKFYAVSILKYA